MADVEDASHAELDASEPAAWTGMWISAAGQAPADMHRAAFRSAVHFDAPPPRLPIRISADARYVLWVNGTEVGRGPVRSQPWRWTFDEHDIAPHLVAGENELAVLVTYYGGDNAIWQRAPVREGLGAQACLVVDAPAGTSIATDELWKAAILPSWSSLPVDGILAGLPIEIVDMRRLDPEWMVSPAFREAMPRASPAPASHIGSRRRATPPVYPFGRLEPREIAALTGDRVAPREVGVAVVRTPTESDDPVVAVTEALGAIPSFSSTPAGGPVPPLASESLLWKWDFGRVVGGFFEFDVVAPAGVTIDIAFLERFVEGGRPERHPPRAGARVITADGLSRFRGMEWNGLRYALVLVRGAGAAGVELSAPRVREHLYPLEGDASFSASAPDLARLWRAGVRTVELNSVDAFTDCPTREQRAWVGDSVVHTEVHLTSSSDWRLARRHLELADSPRPDGLLPMAVACDLEAANGFTIPDWSLHWIHAVLLYARATRDRAFVLARMPSVRRITQWFARFADLDGVLRDVPEWTLGDWSSVFTDERSSILTALWGRALADTAELADWIGCTGEAADARSLHARIAVGFESFWDPARLLYVDRIVADAQSPATSQVANAAAIVAGFVPTQRLSDLATRMTDDARLVTRGWHVESPLFTLEEKLADRADGRRRIDWDVQEEIVRAEPFFSSVVHEAVARAGRADLIPSLLTRWMRFLEDGYDTFGECWEWGTPCHGWSSTPTRDLTRLVLGAAPGPLDGADFVVAPARTDIEHLAAAVPTRHGTVEIEVRGGHVRTRAPIPLEIHPWSGPPITVTAGAHTTPLD